MNEASPTLTNKSPGGGAWLHAYGPALWAAVVCLAGLFFLMVANDIASSSRPGRLGPAFWPRAILIMMVITSALDCAMEARKGPARLAAVMRGEVEEAQVTRIWWLMALGLALMLAYLNLSSVIGFPLATTLFMLVFMLLGGLKRPILALVISLVGSVSLVLIFVKVVYVSLPLGTGPFESLTLLLYSLLGIV